MAESIGRSAGDSTFLAGGWFFVGAGSSSHFAGG